MKSVVARWRRRISERIGGREAAFLRATYAVPRPVVLITAGRGARRAVWPVDWHTPVSLEPPWYVVAMQKGGFGTSVVEDEREFVVNIIPSSWEATILQAGALSSGNIDKFAALGLETCETARLSTVRLVAASGFLECKVDRVEDVGSHLLMVARVVHAKRCTDLVSLTHRSA